ncbi:MAG: neutral/alkaline non-lysosomal ceramidase N-terminal domain-containing protein [Flammeovirgaceae bacterium]|nr:MAG: neutral/alkaline non-lysosomal ceramidase N-terminal domain-containing protein [Flammeovirgaceae bacterium]
MHKVFRVSVRVILGLLTVIILFLAVSIAPVERTLPVDQFFYNEMMSRIDSAVTRPEETDTTALRVGFGKASITPAYPTATAGYVKRKGKPFSAIRDSVFVRTMAIDKEGEMCFIVSLDMLIVPPLLYGQLKEQLPASGYSIDQVFLGATHTHNSIGQWDDSVVGEIYAGDYKADLVSSLAQQVIRSMHNAAADLKPGKFNYGVVAVPNAVTNRLISNGPVDSLLHILEFTRNDGTKGILTSFSAHATCLSSKDLRLSRDYPGELVDQLEASGYTFAMFMAGAVGSHAPIREASGDSKIQMMGSLLTEAVQQVSVKPVSVTEVRLLHIPLKLGNRQIKVLPNWRVRPWLSSRLMGEHEVNLTMLKIGEVVMFGTPCDFSGMLTPQIYHAAVPHKLHAFVTSFNGGYIGYITPDEYYDLDAYETQTMNWYGPGNGSYIQDCLKRIISNFEP